MTKQELRQYIRNEKHHFSQQELMGMAFPIIQKVLDNERVRQAGTILLYHALPDEVPTDEILKELLSWGKNVLLPRVISDTEMTIHHYTGEQDLTLGSFGILEPSGEIYKGTIDLAVIPGMAFDRQRHRLGRGKGYYDRFLSQHPNIHKIGVCFPFQLVDEVPNDQTDILMNEIIDNIAPH